MRVGRGSRRCPWYTGGAERLPRMPRDLHRGAAHTLILKHPRPSLQADSYPRATGLGGSPECPLLLSSHFRPLSPLACHPAPSLPRRRAQSFSPRLLPARCKQQGVGVQSQRKPLFIKLPAPSSTLEAGAWALAPTPVWVTSGPGPTRRSEATGLKSLHAGALQALARSGARAPPSQRTRSGSFQMFR